MSRSHEEVVSGQFSPRADAYVKSAVHAGGEDLAYLVSLVNGRSDANVLDLGCGGGHVSFGAAPHVREVVAYDLSPAMLSAVEAESARRGLANIRTVQGRAEELPFEDGSFDFVLCRFSAHHWGDLHAGLREARRVLKPTGQAGFADLYAPADPALDTFFQAIEIFRDPSHVRDYSLAEWRSALKAAGFAPEEPKLGRLRLEFASWIERMQTPAVRAEAIRSLQRDVSQEIRDYFEVEPDGTFTSDWMVMVAQPSSVP